MTPRRALQREMRLLSLLVLACGTKAQTGFNWSELIPSTNLSWTPCYDVFQCTRFSVPLQYSDPSGEEAALALVMSPSNYSHDDSEYKGPILLNPGGPGDSGISYLYNYGESFREIIGPQFDLVSFDPRGVGETTPYLSVFADAVEAGEFYVTLPMNANESISSVGNLYARYDILGKLASVRASDVAETLSTPTVSQDMLSIVHAFGQEKLQYWGVSYGTVLGATFASMFPDKVERIILDGVMDADKYYAGSWSSNLQYTDAVLTNVYQSCADSGASACPLYEDTVDQIRARVDNIINDVHLAPAVVFDSSGPNDTAPTFGVVDYSTVKIGLLQLLYTPYASAQTFFEGLAALEQGNGSAIYGSSVDTAYTNLLTTCALEDDSASEPYVAGLNEIQTSISCGDQLGNDTLGLQSLRETYDDMLSYSEEWASTWLTIFAAPCSGWPIRGSSLFNGMSSFACDELTTHVCPGSFTQNTSFPLMFIGNTADPVTPIDFAHKMSSGFADSVVLTQNSSGHASISASSTCTGNAIRAYFLNGTLPTNGTVCQVESTMFESASESSSNASVARRAAAAGTDWKADPENRLREAMRAMSKKAFLGRNVGRALNLRRSSSRLGSVERRSAFGFGDGLVF